METALANIITILLKRISVRTLLDNKVQSTRMKGEELSAMFLPYIANYSDTELKHLFVGIEDMLKGYVEFDGNIHSENNSINLFNAIFNFSDSVLVEQQNEILCKYTKLLRWRKVTTQISEETFVLAFMAKRDASYGIQRKCFSHKPVISHNNVQLKTILDNGMSENHFHLMGSAPYFQLSWIQLMNNISKNQVLTRLRDFEKKRRNVNVQYNETYEEESFEIRARQAYLIRLYLFSRLSGIRIKLGEYQVFRKQVNFQFGKFFGLDDYYFDVEYLRNCWVGEKHTILDILSKVWDENTKQRFFRSYQEIYELMIYLCDEILDMPDFSEYHEKIHFLDLLMYFINNRDTILLERCESFIDNDAYNYLWNEKTLESVWYLLQNTHCLILKIPELEQIIHAIKGSLPFSIRDYTVVGFDYEEHKFGDCYADLWGERNFLYKCFMEICKNGYLFSHYESNLFHAYLVIKESIRAEMVQTNDYVGFENFAIHQSRKEYFSSGVEFEKNMARMAVRDTLRTQNIISLEARITPADTAKGNYNIISFFDKAIDEKGEFRNRYYYVFHFIKAQEKDLGTMDGLVCRAFYKRNDIKKRAYALKNFRENYPLAASRVLGIDAAAQEIGCRPEVFATVFRFLKSHTFSYDVGRGKNVLPQLRISYHVGEDFLDIVDGLRAIEEAILFLGMDCGDRLGHALALGVDVNDWYASKGCRVSLPMQDYLDNIVWIYYSIIRYQIADVDSLKSYLEAEFSDCFRKIYGSSINRISLEKIAQSVKEHCANGTMSSSVYERYEVEHVSFVFDIHTYYKAWQLRGDAPELYQKGYYSGAYQTDFMMNSHKANKYWPENFSVRYIPEVAYLYHLYHYSSEVKKVGKKEVDYKVNQSMVRCVKEIQREMQKEIARRGIGIETNPTSNYMISTFKRYAKHPIIKFYNRGLVTNDSELRECPQIWCSINTDDQGVFSASLENEYALMARALEKEKDEQGNPIYNKTMIYQWIDNIRINGNRQSFGLFLDGNRTHWQKTEENEHEKDFIN